MSMEMIAKFYGKMKADEALQEQAKDIQDHAALIAFAKAKGFDFTAEELTVFAAEQAGEAVPLSDEDLEKAAAGGTYDIDGYLLTWLSYSCGYWAESPSWKMWGPENPDERSCRSCKYYHPSMPRILPLGVCRNEANRRR